MPVPIFGPNGSTYFRSGDTFQCPDGGAYRRSGQTVLGPGGAMFVGPDVTLLSGGRGSVSRSGGVYFGPKGTYNLVGSTLFGPDNKTWTGVTESDVEILIDIDTRGGLILVSNVGLRVAEFVARRDELAVKMACVQGRVDAAAAKLDEFESELDAETRRLREKYDYDNISAASREATAELSKLRECERQLGIRVVVSILAAACRANPEAARIAVTSAASRWGFELCMNANVKAENFGAVMDLFANDVCSDEWWEKHRPERQANGLTWVRMAETYEWTPVVRVGLPDAFFERVNEFVDEMSGVIERLANEYAARVVETTDGDEALQRALYEKLKSKFESAS